ncbi:MAG: alpha-hydroxy-acid oxidizing enzyme [Rhodospirillaceae bacterium]|nr:alpha-hydroxy-acid oxidizing enzyme [Rhodospirillaceae bacterium]|tara:strand:- start:4063 stop:5136 length:1074 start_codon:yes stop_codon:yes gene_type:complete
MSDALFETTHDMIMLARRNLDQDNWDYICGAAESETSLRRNRLSLDCLAFRPRICRDVSDINTETEFFGQKLRIPVLLAPMGGIERFSVNGGLDADTAAEEFGTVNFLSTVCQPSLEEVAANSPHPKSFQIYVRGDDDWIRDLVRRVVKADYATVTLTVDSAFYGNRERLNPAQLALRRVASREWQKKITWDTVKLIQDEIGDRPLILKGIMTAEDAALAVEHGVQGVYISNHGGRQLDHVLGNIQMLPEVVAAVDGKAEVFIDGGFTRGTDIVKAIALGAKSVGIGRLQAYGLGAGGAEGLVRCLELLEREIITTMGLIGVTSLDELGPECVTEAMPVTLPHEHSAFPHLPGGRVQ